MNLPLTRYFTRVTENVKPHPNGEFYRAKDVEIYVETMKADHDATSGSSMVGIMFLCLCFGLLGFAIGLWIN